MPRWLSLPSQLASPPQISRREWARPRLAQGPATPVWAFTGTPADIARSSSSRRSRGRQPRLKRCLRRASPSTRRPVRSGSPTRWPPTSTSETSSSRQRRRLSNGEGPERTASASPAASGIAPKYRPSNEPAAEAPTGKRSPGAAVKQPRLITGSGCPTASAGSTGPTTSPRVLRTASTRTVSPGDSADLLEERDTWREPTSVGHEPGDVWRDREEDELPVGERLGHGSSKVPSASFALRRVVDETHAGAPGAEPGGGTGCGPARTPAGAGVAERLSARSPAWPGASACARGLSGIGGSLSGSTHH